MSDPKSSCTRVTQKQALILFDVSAQNLQIKQALILYHCSRDQLKYNLHIELSLKKQGLLPTSYGLLAHMSAH